MEIFKQRTIGHPDVCGYNVYAYDPRGRKWIIQNGSNLTLDQAQKYAEAARAEHDDVIITSQRVVETLETTL